MKKLNLLTFVIAVAALIISVNKTIAQTKQKNGTGSSYVEPFDEGRVLNSTDIRFFNSITGSGNDAHTTVVSGKKFTTGQRITSNEAATLNKAKSDYRKKHKLEKASDGKAINSHIYESCYWYVYNDDANHKYYVWYCD